MALERDGIRARSTSFRKLLRLVGPPPCGVARFPNGVSERKNDGPKNDPRRTEYSEAADDCEKHRNGMQTQSFSDEDRVEQVVDQTDHNSAPQEQDDGLAPLTAGREEFGRGEPNDEGAENRNDC